MARADGYNYVNIGQKLSTSNHMDVGSSGFDVDLFCCEANIGGNDYTQYGNFYVYKGAGAYNGDATFETSRFSEIVTVEPCFSSTRLGLSMIRG